MTATDRTARALVGSYLSRPDPLAWLAYADACEEAGRDDEARLWRWRAEHFDRVMRHFEAVCEWDCGPLCPAGRLWVGDVEVLVWRKPRALHVWARRGGRTVRGLCGWWRVYSKQGPRYLREKVLALIDAALPA